MQNEYIKNYKIIITYGNNSEKKYIKEFKNKNIKIYKDNLKKITDLIKNSKLIISSDTGIAHIAGLYNKNLITIFGPGNLTKWKPLGKNTKILQNAKGCKECERYSDEWKCNRECYNINYNKLNKLIKECLDEN